MAYAAFRFYGHLNNFLAYDKREVDFTQPFKGNRSIKDMIEALGVPHTEIARITVNEEQVDFGYHVRHDDQIKVYPRSETAVIAGPPGDKRFVLDIHLGRLVAHLRMLGFDALYPEDYRDEELARISSDEDRILLTRDIGLLKRSIVKYGYFVQETDPWRQLAEVVKRFDLINADSKLQRCTQCNGILELTDKDSLGDQLLQKTKEHYDEFYVCSACGKIYWKGSHYERLERFMASLSADQA